MLTAGTQLGPYEILAPLGAGALGEVCGAWDERLGRRVAGAHEHPIVHRDLKPDSLFVTRDGRLKILDFGLAKLTGPESGAAPMGDPPGRALSESGMIQGTASPMATEQARGDAVDHREDPFAR